MNKYAVWKAVAISWMWTLGALFSMVVTFGFVLMLSRRFLTPAAFISLIAGFLVISILVFVFSEIIISLFMRAKPARADKYPDFIETADELFRKKKMWVHPRLYVLDMSAPNAMAYGMGFPGFACIAITPALYDLLDREALKAVVAHELGHIRSKDVGLMTTIGLMTGSVEKLRKLLLSGKSNFGKGPFAWIFAAILWLVSKVIFGFLSSAISQERELAADALGAYYIGSPDPLIRALKALVGSSQKSTKSALSGLMVSHPGMNERIQSLQSLKTGG